MATLYQLNQAIAELIERGFVVDEKTGELLFESSDLDGLQEDLETKLENCALFIKDQQALADAIKAEEAALKARRTALEAKVERMRQYTADGLVFAGRKGLETARVKMGLRGTQRVEIINEDCLPDWAWQVVETRKPAKQKIKEALKAGEAVEGAVLIESKTLNVR